jgi:hypothetical protein
MKKIQFKGYASVLTVMMMLMASSVYAGRHDHQLDQKRKAVVHAYLDNLEHANPSGMDNLFVQDGQVVSTSQGHVNAHQFFFDFLPLIETAKVDVGDIYQSISQQGRYSAGFHFSWVLKDGGQGGGHFVDEFVFAKHTAKLKIVYMYENSQM